MPVQNLHSRTHLKPAQKATLLLINGCSDVLALRGAQEHAIAQVRFAGDGATSIKMCDENVANADLRLDFSHLMVEYLFCHPRFGYLNLAEPNPVRRRLRAMGISDTFVETVYERLSANGTVILALVRSHRPLICRPVTSQCDLRFLPGSPNDQTIQ